MYQDSQIKIMCLLKHSRKIVVSILMMCVKMLKVYPVCGMLRSLKNLRRNNDDVETKNQMIYLILSAGINLFFVNHKVEGFSLIT